MSAEKSASYNLRLAYYDLMNGNVKIDTNRTIPVYKFKGYGNDNARIEILRIGERPPEAEATDRYCKDCEVEIDIIVNLSILRASEKIVDDIANALMQILVPSETYTPTVSGFDCDSHYFISSEEVTELFENNVYLHRILTYRDLLTQT